MFAKIFILLFHLISSVQLNHRFSDTQNYIQKLSVTSDAECENQGYIKPIDPHEVVVIDEGTNEEEIVDPNCGTAKQCEDDAILKEAQRVQNLREKRNAKLIALRRQSPFFTKGKSLVKISSNLTFDPIPVVNECVPQNLTNHLKPRASEPSKQQKADVLGPVGAAFSTVGTSTAAVGGALPLILGPTAAVGGPIGLIAVGTALAVVGTILPFFGPAEPEPMTEDEIKDLVQKQMAANNDKLIEGVNREIGNLAACVNENVNALQSKMIYRDVLGDMVLTSKALGMMALNVDGGSFASDGHAILNDKCLKITEYIGEVSKGLVATADLVLVSPMVKAWYDHCKAAMWAFLIGSSRKDNPEGFENKGILLEQTILGKSAFVLGEFADYFKLVYHVTSIDKMKGYWHAAESDKQLFSIMKKHSEIGITYPRLTQDLRPTSSTYCRVCGMFRWNKIGRRKQVCDYGNRMLDCGYGSCPEVCFYEYYETSTAWYGRRVHKLPVKEAGIGNNAAYWKGDEYGYYSYSCNRMHTGYPPTWWDGKGTTISYELCYQWGGTLYLNGDSSF